MNLGSHRLLVGSVVAVATFAVSTSHADPNGPATTPVTPAATAGATAAPPPAAPSAENVAEARKHYEAGIQLFDKEAYEAALAEFERAYQLAPNYRILYNTGKIYRARNDFVAALEAFERFLSEGSNEASAKRTEVLHFVAELKALVATADVTSPIAGADVSIDDVPQGKTPLSGPLRLNPGTRKVTVSKAGFSPATQVVRAVPGDHLSVALQPQSLNITIHGSEPVPVRVWVGWGTTAALAGAAIGFGVAASSESNSLSSDKKQVNNTGSDVASQVKDDYNKMKTFAAVSDVFSVCALAAAGVSTYFTVKFVKRDKGKEETPPPVAFGISPFGASLAGRF